MNRNYDYIKEKLNERIKEGLLPGFSIAIIEDGNVVYKTINNYKEDSIFRLASMTKPITACATLKASELGLINIEDEITKYLDGFNHMKIGENKDKKIELKSYAKKNITIKDILRHESGLGSGPLGDYQVSNRKAPLTLKDAVDEYMNWYLDFEPETKSIYSPIVAMDILCYIIEITSKMSYFDFLRKYILEPLEMVDTTYSLNDNQRKRLVMMYRMNNGKMELDNNFTYEGFFGQNPGFPGGCAGLFSTLNDYTNLALMLSNKGVFKGKRIIEEESIIKMSSDIIPLPKEGIDKYYNWGYSVFVRGEKASFQPLNKGTFGWSGAYSPHFFIDLSDNSGLVFMTNLDNDGGAGSPNIKILEEAYSKIKY